MHASRTLLLDALERQSVIVVQHSSRRTEPRHSCGTLLRDTLVGPRGTLVGTLRRRFCATALNWEDTLFKCSWGTLVKKKTLRLWGNSSDKLLLPSKDSLVEHFCGGPLCCPLRFFRGGHSIEPLQTLRQSLKSPTTVLQGGFGAGHSTAPSASKMAVMR